MTTYFNKTKWPEKAPKSEEEQKDFIASLHKRKTELFMVLIEKKLLPLRPGVTNFQNNIWCSDSTQTSKPWSKEFNSSTRYVNARAEAATEAHKFTAQKKFCNVSVQIHPHQVTLQTWGYKENTPSCYIERMIQPSKK
ncbi:hypothetical protein DCAR_0522152 [Daucus carota subsp. sativus]|uniref:Uncharacterized protein n=1 Tax=Daucus carota subsp. sativus TaxID=79200 RepID=A0A164ZM47_DAUCS|nr:hypothetical protein DCAR_0522152 [Daucus carota subsp. sativus]